MSSEGEGVVGIISNDLCKFMFSGVIFPPANKMSMSSMDKNGVVYYGLTGFLIDHFGESLLHGVRISSEELTFQKEYVLRHDRIEYKFNRQGDLWVGGYTGPAVGIGGAKCIITEVRDDFFVPPEPILFD